MRAGRQRPLPRSLRRHSREHVDAPTAVHLAKAMIRDGRMPTPEDAAQQVCERLERDHRGEDRELRKTSVSP